MKHDEFKSRQLEAERRFVRKALVKCDWRCTATARALGLAPTTLLSTLARLGLDGEYRLAKQRLAE